MGEYTCSSAELQFVDRQRMNIIDHFRDKDGKFKYLIRSKGVQGCDIGRGCTVIIRKKQLSIAEEVEKAKPKRQHNIVLPAAFGPYTLDFSASGQFMAVGGRNGRLTILDMETPSLISEFQVQETVRDIAFLHSGLLAVAQEKYPYIYNQDGTELHCFKEHGAVLKLQFLKSHFLLASINELGQLHYHDVTTSQMVANHGTGLGHTDVMRANPYNSAVAVGNSDGMVSMWNPTSGAPLVNMLTHDAPVSALSFHSDGHLMATAGMDKKIKLWDLRKQEVIQTLPFHAKALDFCQEGYLATSTGSLVAMFKDLSGSQNYIPHSNNIMDGQVDKVLFRPFDVVLLVGHAAGFSTIRARRSEASSEQKREKEVWSFLDKLPLEPIMLDPAKIGTVELAGNNVEKVKRPFMEQQLKEACSSECKKQKLGEESELQKSLQ